MDEQSRIIAEINSRERESSDSSIRSDTDLIELVESLRSDLQLAGQVGQSLLNSKHELEIKLEENEKALVLSLEDGSQLQSRLEQTTANLEQADASNRALLVSQEEDRKRITRLSVETAKFLETSSKLASINVLYSDTTQELAAETKRANSTENRLKKQNDRVVEMEERLKTALEDLGEMRQDKVLRSKKSREISEGVREKMSRTFENRNGIEDNSDATELLKLIESLVEENESLKSSTTDLQEMLEKSREGETKLRNQIEKQLVFGDSEEDADKTAVDRDDMSYKAISPSLTRSHRSSDNPPSPSFNGPHSFMRPYPPPTFNAGVDGLNRASSIRSNSTDGKSTRRRPVGMNGAMALPSSGTVPIGKGHVRRASSVDVQAYGGKNMNGHSIPPSPMQDDRSPSTQSQSNFSDAEDFIKPPRRHPRPLSLSLGPSLFPIVPEGRRSPSMVSYGRVARSSHPPTSTSTSLTTPDDLLPITRPSGITLSSPTKRLRRSSTPEPILEKIDFSTQTIPIPALSETIFSPTSSTSQPPPRRPNESISISSISELSERERGRVEGIIGLGENRTAVLSGLIEYCSKLFIRIQGADITSQEKRLKKQHLSGDVKFLASANLKDLINDIEGLRNHFRRILEIERATLAKDSNNSPSENDSLVNRRDFVDLVKLFRDLLFETSRLRSLVNRIELDPSLATSIRNLDLPSTIERKQEEVIKMSGGLLAPITRMFGAVLLGSDIEPPIKATPSTRVIRGGGGSSGISAAMVNVEFGSGGVRATTNGITRDGSPTVIDSPNRSSQLRGNVKSGGQVKRDLNSIFAGRAVKANDPWVVLPTPTNGAPTSSLAKSFSPFGRLLGYRPAINSTTNAVLDSIPTESDEPTLLERTRTLRPRGLSDSSIRSTFISSSKNPHHKLINPVSSSTIEPSFVIGASSVSGFEGLAVGSLSRKNSIAALRSNGMKSSKEESTPPVPTIPIAFSVSPQPQPISLAIPQQDLLKTSTNVGSSSMFDNLSSWASKAVLSPLAIAAENETGGSSNLKIGSLERAARIGERGGRDLS